LAGYDACSSLGQTKGGMDMEELVVSYAKGYELLMQAVQGVTEEELSYKPAPDKWSINEIVVHVCDGEMVAVDRMKRVIAEQNPLLFAFDPDLWSSGLGYQEQDHEPYLELFKLLRATMTAVLSNLGDEVWTRTGIHSVNGKLTLQDIVQGFVTHVDRHLQQIDRVKLAFASRHHS
jgi:hypothetical protein